MRQPITPKPNNIIAQVPGSGTALGGTLSRGSDVGKWTGLPPSVGGVDDVMTGVEPTIAFRVGGVAIGGARPSATTATGASGGVESRSTSWAVLGASAAGWCGAGFGCARVLAAMRACLVSSAWVRVPGER